MKRKGDGLVARAVLKVVSRARALFREIICAEGDPDADARAAVVRLAASS